MLAARRRYEPLQLLGRGGMAEVHLARAIGPLGLQKIVVLKRVLPALAKSEEFVRMFLEEARLALRLDHPNIVQVFDVDEADGVVFYAMEFLHGRDLRQIVTRLVERGARLSLEQALSIMIPVCAALHYAHERADERGRPLSIVHRDITPHNVFIRYDGVVKVIDFGIAKAADRLERTAAGVLKGKL